ncbi:P-loop NTPase fold protein [Mucilaginibacter sp. cycad4]|uniref:P-loop NTPase fold protein n=1 Tax=Mucilaginibacter sp. cycad4 TaxID=3342096 RepID=UPI002AAB8D15|nr:P-loop NTPase fold protein [Mucilaginibacter gossypii]WPV01645.1 P-loop NTPase fold protein [Mucilaginibacter gossypii]
MPLNKIVVKLDSLFNTISDAIVIPRSTIGTLNDKIRQDLAYVYRLELPERLEYRPLGAVDIMQHTNQDRQNNLKPVFHILMATCVDNNTSTYEAIEDIANEISDFTKRNPTVRDVALPLLGTGAGGLDHMRVFQILTENFIKNSSPDAVMEIFVTEERIFSLIRPQIPQDRTSELPKIELTSEQSAIMEQILDRISRDHDCYLAGAVWDGSDKADDFFAAGIWQNGHEDKFVELVKKIKPGSLILLKSSFASTGVSYLRIKGIGIVTLNPGNGQELSVNWRAHHTQYDIPNKGNYRNTITKVAPKTFLEIIRAIPEWQQIIFKIFPPDSSVYEPEFAAQISQLAGLLSDSDDADDHLDINADVDAFAKIISAKTFKPPLAIALFGKWGTGKSFFMRKLKDKISYYTQQQDDMVCTGIAHIHFNAWSYLDANLWASMISKIFEGLNQYISDNKKSDVEINEVKTSLMDRLSLNFLQMEKVKKEQATLTSAITDLTEKKEKLASELEGKKKEIAKDSFTKALQIVDEKLKVREKISSAFKENESVTSASKELREIVPEEYLKDPGAVLKKVQSIETYVKVFFSRKKLLSNILWLAGIILFVYYAPLVLHWLVKLITKTDFSFPPVDLLIKTLVTAAPVLHLIRKTYMQVQPLVSSLWKIKVEYDTAIKDAQAALEKEEAEIALSIAQNEQKLIAVDKEIKETERQQLLLTYKKEHALSTEALYSFIGKRTISEDYQQHLGIVSLIRRDFEALSDLFYGHNVENKHKDFAENFNKPLQRIVLYIDDLDRCREDRVVEVLEAVNLLMAFPLFVVVVGVDPRWVRNALITRYGSQFAPEGDKELIEASDYLEKIFQVPFHLKAANDGHIRHMIRMLSKPYEAFDFENEVPIYDENSPIVREYNEEQNQERHENIIPEPPVTAPVEPRSQLQHVKLQSWEIALMEDMSVILGNNPRAIKRFVNIYQIVKAHSGLTYMVGQEKTEYLIILFLDALYNGCYRKLAPCFIKFMQKNETAKLAQFLQDFEKQSSDIVLLKKQLDVALTTKPAYQTLQDTVMTHFKAHNGFIQRFSFDEILPESSIFLN